MKILQSSDWHADWKTSGVDRFEDVKAAVLQTVRTAIEERVHLYLFTGDLCDPEDGALVLRSVNLAIAVAVRLARAGIPSRWVPGNHDVVENGSGLSTLYPLRNVDEQMVYVLDEPFTEDFAGTRMVYLPYPPATRPYSPAEFVADLKRGTIPATGTPVVVAGHLQVEGATPGDETTEMARGRDVLFPFEECDPSWLLLNGHYHQGQVFERAGRSLHVPGSLVRLNHGEEKNRPRYLLWEL